MESRPTGYAFKNLDVDQLHPFLYQPRTWFDQDELQQLAQNIKQNGVIEPLVARPSKRDPGQYEIIAGERRWRASMLARLESVPTVVRDVDDKAALSMSLSENIKRQSLSPIEEANGIQNLITQFELTHEQAANLVGYNRATVSHLLRCLALPDKVQTLVNQKKLSLGHAKAILSVPDESQMILAANRIANKNLSVREAERLCNKLLQQQTNTLPVKHDADVDHVIQSMSENLGTKTKLDLNQDGSGKLEFTCFGFDHLSGVLEKLNTHQADLLSSKNGKIHFSISCANASDLAALVELCRGEQKDEF